MPPAAFTDNKSAIAALFQQALFDAYPALCNDTTPFVIEVEKPKNPDHGHFAVNSALQLAKKLGLKPRDIAAAIVNALPASDLLAGTPEIAGPGFINIRLASKAETRIVAAIFSAGDNFGNSALGWRPASHGRVCIRQSHRPFARRSWSRCRDR